MVQALRDGRPCPGLLFIYGVMVSMSGEGQRFELWRRNLPVVWAAIFFGIFSFSFIFPFLPLYIRTLGVDDPGRAALWSGLVGGAGGLGMFIGAPIWGMVGDRYGRKKNLVRALLCTGVTLALTGLSTNVYQLMAFRLVGGLMSGIPPTAMALVASQAPRAKTSFCMGLLQMAIYTGTTVGPLIGGFLTGMIGFQNSFYAAGGMLGLIGLVVMVMVKEEFQRPEELTAATPLSQFRLFFEAVTTREVLGVLGVLFMLQFSPMIMFPVLPLFLEEIAGSNISAVYSGIAFSVMGLTSAVSALFMARGGEKIGLKNLIVICAALSGLFYLPMLLVNAPYQVIILMGIFGLFSGAMLGSTSALLGLAVPREQHGRAFGASQSAFSIAIALGPVIGGVFASGLGLRYVFLVSAVVFFIVAFISMRFITIQGQQGTSAQSPGDGPV